MIFFYSRYELESSYEEAIRARGFDIATRLSKYSWEIDALFKTGTLSNRQLRERFYEDHDFSFRHYVRGGKKVKIYNEHLYIWHNSSDEIPWRCFHKLPHDFFELHTPEEFGYKSKEEIKKSGVINTTSPLLKQKAKFKDYDLEHIFREADKYLDNLYSQEVDIR